MAHEEEFKNAKEGTYSYEVDGETIVKNRKAQSPKVTEMVKEWEPDEEGNLTEVEVEREFPMDPALIENGGLLCIVWHENEDGSGWFIRRKEYVKNSTEPTVILEQFDEDGKLTNSVTK